MRSVVDPETGEVVDTYTVPPNPQNVAEVGEHIEQYRAALDEALPDLDFLTREAADAEADWLLARSTALVELAAANAGRPKGERVTVGVLDAQADLAAHEEHRRFLIAREAVRAKREYLHTLRAQLSAQQTLGRLVGDVL